MNCFIGMWENGSLWEGKQPVRMSCNIMFPKGSLLYLKNHTRGDAERVFEYVDGEQVFR